MAAVCCDLTRYLRDSTKSALIFRKSARRSFFRNRFRPFASWAGQLQSKQSSNFRLGRSEERIRRASRLFERLEAAPAAVLRTTMRSRLAAIALALLAACSDGLGT